MEVVEICQEKKFCPPKSINHKKSPASIRCTKKYVQPPRVQPFKPQVSYCPPKNPVDTKTTYHTSFDQEGKVQARPQPFKPCHNINLPDAKFVDDTTTHLSYKPVQRIYKEKPILPRQRICPQQGPMENVTTIRKDFAPKCAPRAEKIVPCGHIRTSTGLFETKTTSLLSYVNPGPVDPVTNFKPQLQYCQPKERTAQETTQKLSYLPYEVGKKENYPWGKKPCYKAPEISMAGETTYKKSYHENKAPREKPIIPKEVGVFPRGREFLEGTVYKESFLPCRSELVTPIVPCGNISLANDRMSVDTTNKLSFQQVKAEKRKPILPRPRICGVTGPMPSDTTNRLSYTLKIGKRPNLAVPCGHIRTAKQPLDAKTTTKLSYVSPGQTQQFPNFRPVFKYCKPEEKIEADTVNKLSYQQWSIGPKEKLPWAEKPRYCKPNEKMPSDTIYHRSFPPPGHFVDESEPSREECQCASEGEDGRDGNVS
ncbi:uncharacterized protein LOC131668217 [Phymastichus coffea]|uniref:uncharacterized protein LOC131668217 n=1 Tax=Phymastichus coffea TaxID=108790 RepID=UPI00273BB0E8|nr:uncharacterized protein LOC131668217 [Phymastichus coffea]